jgi:hypothetical protein
MTWAGSGRLTGLLPGEAPRTWEDSLPVGGMTAGPYALALRAPNPLPKGNPVRFANATQDADVKGWLTLCGIRLD